MESKKNKLVDIRLADLIDKNTYEAKYSDLVGKQEQFIGERDKFVEIFENKKDIKRRLKEFKKSLEQNMVLEEFGRYVFESVVDKVIIGRIDEDINNDPAQITFAYKTGLKNSLNADKFKSKGKL